MATPNKTYSSIIELLVVGCWALGIGHWALGIGHRALVILPTLPTLPTLPPLLRTKLGIGSFFFSLIISCLFK
ncbi:hypothetical protein BLD44_015765 [Mastigocladus laminosus UU774]|nr:hypothetical protein BLD44_015765 [Mastigocladus laminosus UU774]